MVLLFRLAGGASSTGHHRFSSAIKIETGGQPCLLGHTSFLPVALIQVDIRLLDVFIIHLYNTRIET